MMKNILSYIAFVLIVLAFLYAISGKKYPRIPADSLHASVSEPVACMGCHGPEKQAALKKEHPPKYECFKCHKVRRVNK